MASLPSGDGLRLQRAEPVAARRDSHALRALPADHRQSLPAGPALQIARLVQRWNVGAEQLLGPLGLRAEQLEEPFAQLSVDKVSALIARARELTGEPGLGFYIGLEKRVTSYGYLGFAAMSAATVREALELTVRFVPAQTAAFSVQLQREGELAALTMDFHADFGDAEDVFVLGAVVGLWQIGSALTGKELGGLTELTFAEPSYYRRFAQLLPQVRFGQPATRLVFDAAVLDLPLVSADRAALRLAREQCQAALDALIAQSTLAKRARGLVARAGDSPISMGELAATLGMSPRSLKRKLAAQGVSFSALLADARRESAQRLLRTSSLSLDSIAERLGYSTTPNFIRAFRRWTGETPNAYRRSAARAAGLE